MQGRKPSQMSTEGGGPKSMIKSHAENFARHLQSRLRSLSESEDGTWTSAGDPASLSSSSENETFFEIDSNITSPEEEITEPEFIAHTNYVDNLSTTPTNIHLCNKETELSKRDSLDEQFFDTVDLVDIDRSEESPPVACLCKPVSLPFPIPFSPSSNHHQYRNSQEDAHINGTLENTYLDAELSNSDCDGCSKLEEHYNSPVVVNCNGFQSSKTRIENADFTNEIYNHLKLNYANEESESNECVTAEGGIERLQDVPTVIKTCTQNNECSNNLSINIQQQKLENKTLNEFEKTMNEQIDKSFDDEEKLSLKDLLHVIHKELKLEGTQINGPSSSSARSGPEIKILEIPTIPEVSSSKTTARSGDEEEEDIETRRLRFRRCSSLKSGKTPPGTPGRKKIVRFADVLGLDLADVKTFMDEVPTIPKSAYEDLYGVESSTLPTVDPFGRISQPTDRKERVVIPLFQQPGGHPNFIEKVCELNVCLENAVVSDPSLLAITGTVRVKNLDFHKSVHIRYSLNSWKSFADLQAKYVPNSCDGFSDKFSFLMYAHTLTVGQRLEFAVRFQARGTQFWDNNGGVNYVFECVSQDNPCLVAENMPSSPIDSWPTFY